MFCVLLLVVCMWAVADQLPRLGKRGREREREREKERERADLSAIVCLWSCGFCSERFSLPVGAWDGLRYFNVALPGPSK